MSPRPAGTAPEDDELSARLRSALRAEAEAVAPFSGRTRSIAAIHDWAAKRRRARRRALSGATGLVVACTLGISAAVLANRPPAPTSVGVTAPVEPQLGAPLHHPTAAPVPAPAMVPGGAVPAGFEPLSATFVTPDIGYVLGVVPCTGGGCPLLASTTDGGSTWVSLGDPDPAGTVALDLGSPLGVHLGLRFADQEHGWIYGYVGSSPVLWWTSDGGTTWSSLQPAAVSGGEIVALEAMEGRAEAVVVRAEPSGVQVASADKASPAWKEVSLPLSAGPRSDPTPELVLQGNAGWLVVEDPGFVSAARLTRYGTWERWSPSCTNPAQRVLLAAASSTDLFELCQPTSEGARATVYRSRTGGTPGSWAYEARTPPGLDPQALAANRADSFAVAGSLDGRAVIYLHTPGSWTGPTWSGSGRFSELGFEDPTQGIAIVRSAGSSEMLMTFDGGARWGAVDFQRTPPGH